MLFSTSPRVVIVPTGFVFELAGCWGPEGCPGRMLNGIFMAGIAGLWNLRQIAASPGSGTKGNTKYGTMLLCWVGKPLGKKKYADYSEKEEPWHFPWNADFELRLPNNIDSSIVSSGECTQVSAYFSESSDNFVTIDIFYLCRIGRIPQLNIIQIQGSPPREIVPPYDVRILNNAFRIVTREYVVIIFDVIIVKVLAER